jgi:hypothetical protein
MIDRPLARPPRRASSPTQTPKRMASLRKSPDYRVSASAITDPDVAGRAPGQILRISRPSRMNPMRSTLIVAAATTLLTTVAAAQKPSPRTTLVLTVGLFHPDQPLRAVPRDGESVYSGLTTGPVLGLAAEIQTPLPGIAVRASGSYARLEMEVGSTEEEQVTSRSAVAAVGIDGVIRGPRVGTGQPYLLLGAWVRRYDFDQEALTRGAAETYLEDEVRRAGHAGVGVVWSIGRWALIGEAGGWFGQFDDGGESAAPVRQQDFHATIGIRIPVL